MKVKRIVAAASILTAALLALTACDPPMPPEVVAANAEATYTCIEGNSTVSAPDQMTDLALGWADSLSYSCYDPEPVMTFSQVAEDQNPDLEISEYAPVCKPVETVPFAVEAGVLVYMESEVNSLSISPKSLGALLSGDITNWKQLEADNPGYEMPDYPISIVPTADTKALQSITDYLKLEKVNVKNKEFVATDKPSIDLYSALEEGQVAIVPNSYAVTLGLYPAAIYKGMDAEESPILAVPDVSGIQSASTQWVMNSAGHGVSVTLDPTKNPTPPEGSDSAPIPYQAIYPVNMSICNSSLLPRAVGRFLLRLDSQGALGASNYTPIPEGVRISSLISVSKGLPTPSPTSTE